MEQENKESVETPAEGHYVPRPVWQVWAARIGLALFLIFIVFYYLNIFGGKG